MKASLVPFYSLRCTEYSLAQSIQNMADEKRKRIISREFRESMTALANVHLLFANELMKRKNPEDQPSMIKHIALRWHCMTVIKILEGAHPDRAEAWVWNAPRFIGGQWSW